MRASYRRQLGWTKAHEGRRDYRAASYRVRHRGHPTVLGPYYGETGYRPDCCKKIHWTR